MSGPSKSRLKRNLIESVDALCRTWAERTALTVEDVHHAAADVFLKQPAAREIVEQKCIERDNKRKRGQWAIEKSVQFMWGKASRLGTVSSTPGMEARRIVSSFLAGEGASYKDAHSFLGGNIGRDMFDGAKLRHATVIQEDEISHL